MSTPREHHDVTESDDDLALLGSPIERRALGRLFILGGPIGLAIAIMAGLWIAQQHVSHAVIVQVEPQWIPEDRLAVRVQVVPELPIELDAPQVTLSVEQEGSHTVLPAPQAVGSGAIVQGTFVVPSLTPGPATLLVDIEAPPFAPRQERLPIEIVEQRAAVEGRHVVSTSMSQYADDSDPQPDEMKIDVRPLGRVLAGFSNELLVRATDRVGRPWFGPAMVWLLDGEFDGKRGDPDDPPLLWKGSTDAAGLASIEGVLASEVLRLRVELLSLDDRKTVIARRKIRLVSFAGAVDLKASALHGAPGEPLEIAGAGLGGRRPVFVDVFGPDGAWIDTFAPPIVGHEPPRPWEVPADLDATEPGLIQFEGYHFTNAPGESTAVARVGVGTGPPQKIASLRPLVDRQRATLDDDRNDRTWDEKREGIYLDALTIGPLPPSAVASARRFLIGTLPIVVHGPPQRLHSRQRDLDDLLAKKQRWALMVRVFLLVGGGLFLMAMTFAMARSHAKDAAATMAELSAVTDGEEREELALHVERARRSALWQGLLIIVLMAAGIACTLVTLEVFVWDF